MPFISQKTLEELRRDARIGGDIKKIQKKFDKDLTRMSRQYEEWREDVADEHDAEVRTLTRAARKVTDAVKEAKDVLTADHKVVIADLTRDHKAAIDAKNDEITQLKGKITVLEARVKTTAELTAAQLDIDDEKDELARTADFLADREEELNKSIIEFDKKVEDKKNHDYNRGLTDGVSNTLREGQALAATANERVFNLATTALNKETTVITTAAAQKQGK